jgi:hypothetical protein
MDNIKTIGGVGGIFHIFVPGVFLLINCLSGVYLFPWSGDDTRKVLFDVFGNPALGLVLTISFGYLLGVILRIFRSESADRLSAKYLRKFGKNWGQVYFFDIPPLSTKKEYRCRVYIYHKCLKSVDLIPNLIVSISNH